MPKQIVEKRSFSVGMRILLLCLTVVPLSCDRAQPPLETKAPNILLITACSLRADHLGCYGYPRATSPHLDAFAGTATLFKRCYTPIPWTAPATLALMTGVFPRFTDANAPSSLLTERLHSRGYFTCGIIGTNVVRQVTQINKGFDLFFDNLDMPTDKDSASVRAATVVAKAQEVLRSNPQGSAPIFLWLFLKDPHFPYRPPEPYDGLFLRDSYAARDSQELPINADRKDPMHGIGDARLKNKDGTFITNKGYYIAQYDGEIAYMDQQIGALFAFLKSEERFDEWLIIFVGDHGEAMGEEGQYFAHQGNISEALLRVPLLIKMPGQKEPRILQAAASLCDIPATLLASVGIRAEGRDSISLHGLLRPSKVWAKRRRVCVVQNDRGYLQGYIWRCFKLQWDGWTKKLALYILGKERKVFELCFAGNQKIAGIIHSLWGHFSRNRKITKPFSVEALRALSYIN